MMCMKILLVSATPPPEGGIGTWTKGYIKYLKNTENILFFVNQKPIGKRGEKINARFNIIDEIKRMIRILKEMQRVLKENKPEIVHINTSCSNKGIIRDYICARMSKKEKCAVVLHCHCNIKDQLSGKISYFFLKETLKISDKIFVLNNSSKIYVNKMGYDNVIIIPNFIESREIVLHEIRSNIHCVLFVGHVQKEKGIDDIIRIAEKFPEYVFKIVGPIREDVDIFHSPPNVLYVGSIDHKEVKKYMLEADVFLFPSHSEGFPMAVLEAMTYGVPIIATKVGAIEDMIETEGGILVNVWDGIGLEKALIKMADQRKRTEMSLWNQEKVKQNYLVEKVVFQILTIYREVLDKDSPIYINYS